MSMTIDVTISCSSRSCRQTMDDGDAVYCEDCAGADGSGGQSTAEAVRDWHNANILTMKPWEIAFLERVADSMERRRPLKLAVAS